MGEEKSYLAWMLDVLKRSVELGGFPEEVYHILSKPERVLAVSIPVRMDNGKLVVFEGYRVQHSSALGPYKGGVRFHPEVDLETDIALALGMTLKNSLSGLPYGGGKGAVKVDPTKLSPGELERVSRGYVRAIAPLIDDELDIPAPDVGTNPQIMIWMIDEYSKIRGRNVPGVFTGKPPELWGDPVRPYSTGYGVAVVAREIANRFLGGLEGLRVAIHGFGNVGSNAARFLSKFGAKIVAVSDLPGTLYNPNGLDVEKMIQLVQRAGGVKGLMEYSEPGTSKTASTEDALYADVDILVPASIENVININNAHKVKAKIIVEGANGPTTADAEKILYEKGTIIIPDILANAGGVIVSYLEWVENLQWFWWGEEETLKRLENIMINNVKRLLASYDKYSSSRGVKTYRETAFILAVERLYRAMKLRGWI